MYETLMKRDRDPEGDDNLSVYEMLMKSRRREDDSSRFHIELRWQLVGEDGKATTIPPNGVFTVPASVLKLTPYEALVVNPPGKYVMVHAISLERTHRGIDLGSGVYIFFSDETLSELRKVVPGLPAPDPRLKDPSRALIYPNGYRLQNE